MKSARYIRLFVALAPIDDVRHKLRDAHLHTLANPSIIDDLVESFREILKSRAAEYEGYVALGGGEGKPT